MAAPYKTPGVYVQEIPTLPPSVAEVATAIPAFIGCTEKGPVLGADGKIEPIVQRIASLFEYEPLFGKASPSAFTVTSNAEGTSMEAIKREDPAYEYLLYDSLSLYARNGGGACYIISIGNYDAPPTRAQFEAGLAALEKEDEPTLILLTDAINLAADDYYSLCQQALAQCFKLKDRFAILDVLDGDVKQFRDKIGNLNLRYGAAYHPYLQTALVYQSTPEKVSVTIGGNTTTLAAMESSDPPSNNALSNQIKAALTQQRVILPPSSAVAGVMTRVDGARGVWKAPANESLLEVIGPVTKITNGDQDDLNIDPTAGKSINAIRAFTGKGTLIWGARTLAGNDNEWRYINVRRLFNMIEESVQKSTSFAVFEPNDPTTWLKVRAVIESFLYGLWQQGALVGPTPEAAYFVNVGLGKTMTPQDVLEGRMIVELGLAASRPAEFIILRFSHRVQQA